MQQKYKVLENDLRVKSKSAVFCLPGNYDMDLRFTALHRRDLHMHWYELDDLKLAGYGGADIWTAGIPERYVVKYRAGAGTKAKDNQMLTFFKAVKPNVVVLLADDAGYAASYNGDPLPVFHYKCLSLQRRPLLLQFGGYHLFFILASHDRPTITTAQITPITNTVNQKP